MDIDQPEAGTTNDQGKAADPICQDKPKSKRRFPFWIVGLLLVMISFLWIISQLQQLLK